MLSKPLTLGLLAVGCLAAAGGGAYFATLQHARNTAALAPQAQSATQEPVGATGQLSSSAPAEPLQTPAPDLPATAVAPPEPAPVRGIPEARGTVPTPRANVRGPKPASQEKPSVGEAAKPAVPDASSAAPLNRAAPPLEPLPATTPTATPEASAVEAPATEPATAPEPAWEELTVPSESVLGLQLETPLSSETARVEDRVEARVSRDVRVRGRVAIPYGTRVLGSVVLVERGGKVKERARIGIRFTTLVLADSTRLEINTDTITREGEPPSHKSSAKIGGGAIGGAIIGAILGGGKGAAIGSGIGAAGGTAAVMAGDRATAVLAAGTPLSIRIVAPLTVTVEK